MILLQGEDQHSVYRTRERSTGLERGVQDRGEERRTGLKRGVQDKGEEYRTGLYGTWTHIVEV